MPRRIPQHPVHVRSARLLDVENGEYVEPGALLIQGERIIEVSPTSASADAEIIGPA